MRNEAVIRDLYWNESWGSELSNILPEVVYFKIWRIGKMDQFKERIKNMEGKVRKYDNLSKCTFGCCFETYMAKGVYKYRDARTITSSNFETMRHIWRPEESSRRFWNGYTFFYYD